MKIIKNLEISCRKKSHKIFIYLYFLFFTKLTCKEKLVYFESIPIKILILIGRLQSVLEKIIKNYRI